MLLQVHVQELEHQVQLLVLVDHVIRLESSGRGGRETRRQKEEEKIGDTLFARCCDRAGPSKKRDRAPGWGFARAGTRRAPRSRDRVAGWRASVRIPRAHLTMFSCFSSLSGISADRGRGRPPPPAPGGCASARRSRVRPVARLVHPPCPRRSSPPSRSVIDAGIRRAGADAGAGADIFLRASVGGTRARKSGGAGRDGRSDPRV